MTRTTLPAVIQTATTPVEGFPYDVISEKYREIVRQNAFETKRAFFRSIAAYIEVGRLLRVTRPLIPHGQWAKYVKRAVEMSMSWARACIALHERFVEQRPDVVREDLQISVTALIHLATAPDAAIDEVVERCSLGEKLIIDEVDGVIQRHGGRPHPEQPGTAKAKQLRPSPKLQTAHHALTGLSREGVTQRLIPQIIDEMFTVLEIFENAEEIVVEGRAVSKQKLEQDVREVARRLTDGLEQATQLRADTTTKLTHKTYLSRGTYPAGNWAIAASFHAEISTSEGWERIKKDDLGQLVSRGVNALRDVLIPTAFTNDPHAPRSAFRLM